MIIGLVLMAALVDSIWPVTTANPEENESNVPIISKVEQINLYQDGEVSSLNELEGISGVLLTTLQELNLQARCAFSQERIDEIKQKDKAVELIFREPVDITISQFIEEEERHHIATAEYGYRILEEVKTAIFVLEDNSEEGLEAHVLVGSEYDSKIGYGCWAIKQKESKELDKRWCDELNEGLKAYSETLEQEFVEVSQEESEEIAKSYLLNSPTFRFDGIEDTLELIATNEVTCPYCWEFVFEFQCRHAGYGDRTGQMLAEVITPHTARIIVEQGVVISAIMDEKWGMMKQKMIEGDTNGFPCEPQEEIVATS